MWVYNALPISISSWHLSTVRISPEYVATILLTTCTMRRFVVVLRLIWRHFMCFCCRLLLFCRILICVACLLLFLFTSFCCCQLMLATNVFRTHTHTHAYSSSCLLTVRPTCKRRWSPWRMSNRSLYETFVFVHMFWTQTNAHIIIQPHFLTQTHMHTHFYRLCSSQHFPCAAACSFV